MTLGWNEQEEQVLIKHLGATPKLQYHTIARLMKTTTNDIRDKAFSLRLLDHGDPKDAVIADLTTAKNLINKSLRALNAMDEK